MKILPILMSLSAISTPFCNIAANTVSPMEETEAEEPEACTVMYIGKDVSRTGNAMIARSADAAPQVMNMNCQIFEHNQLANQVVKGKTGFEYKMPSTTYKYMSTPRNPIVGKGFHWEASGINEMGVGVSATLSCATNNNALKADPRVATGITEDNICQVLSATSKTAREAMKILAHIMDTQGSNESNIVMAIDQNEAWLMEMYTGHQYCAIKLPDNKACTIGNEFFLDSLKELIDEGLLTKDNIITSPNLYTLAKTGTSDVAPFLSPADAKDVYEMDLFKTYARPLSGDYDDKSTDACHMRTWRGQNLFAKTPIETYEPATKYSPFFEPYAKIGAEEIKIYMRDRFGNIIFDETNPAHELFYKRYLDNTIRPVAVKTAYQIHIIEAIKDLPKEICLQERLCMSNSSYAPFVMINNGVDKLNSYYTHVSTNPGWDLQSAEHIYKALNFLGDEDEIKYGLPIQSYWIDMEHLLDHQYYQVLNDVSKKDVNFAKDVLTNFCLELQKVYLETADLLTYDLSTHIANTETITGEKITYSPKVNVKEYAAEYGWNDYQENDKVVTVSKLDETVRIEKGNPVLGTLGKIYLNDYMLGEIKTGLFNKQFCVEKNKLDLALRPSDDDIVMVNINDYITKNTFGVGAAIGASIGVAGAAGIGVAIYFALSKKKKNKI